MNIKICVECVILIFIFLLSGCSNEQPLTNKKVMELDNYCRKSNLFTYFNYSHDSFLNNYERNGIKDVWCVPINGY
jgi:hypothetical protein